ncbi:ABC transporter permease [candidate division KSB1 bacterium]
MKEKVIKPPKIASLLIYMMIPGKDRVFIWDDINEVYYEKLKNNGKRSANLWYWKHVMKNIPGFFFYSVLLNVTMIKSYIKTAFRSLRKQKVYSLINIAGLSVGLAGFGIFAVIAGVNFNADKFHKNAENIYGFVQVINIDELGTSNTTYFSGPMITSIGNEIPEFETVTKMIKADRIRFRSGNDSFYEDGILFADENFFSVFSFDLIYGNKRIALSDPNSIILSEASAEKYFGLGNPVGRNLRIEDDINVRVAGVFKNVIGSSSLQFNFLVSLETAGSYYNDIDNVNRRRFTSFALVDPKADVKLISEKLALLGVKNFSDLEYAPQDIYLFPLLDFRLRSQHLGTIMENTMEGDQYIYLSMGLVLLIVVGINFMNLSTARYMSRSREIGLRKVIGAQRSQLIKQFLGESLLMSIIALPVAIMIFESVLPILAAEAGMENYSGWVIQTFPFMLVYLVEAALIIGLISGIYPAFFLSSFNPLRVIKGSYQAGTQKSRGRKILIVSQFALSIILIILSFTLNKQYDYLLEADFRFDRSNTLVTQVSGLDPGEMDILKSEVGTLAEVRSVTFARNIPVRWQRTRPIKYDGSGEELSYRFDLYPVGNNFVETMGIRIIEGRDFSELYNEKENVIINKASVEALGMKDPIGKQIRIDDEIGNIVGVVDNYQFRYIRTSNYPAVLTFDGENVNYMFAKITQGSDITAQKETIIEKWKEIFPDTPVNCFTLEEGFIDSYRYIELIAGLINLIGIAAVFFSCMGLMGLVSFLIQRRSKEIGIRKVLGSSVSGVIWLFMKEFLMLVGISLVIAFPVAYFASNGLLQLAWQEYAADMGVMIFIIAAMIAFVTAVSAVFFQILKAANSNPVDTIRYE